MSRFTLRVNKQPIPEVGGEPTEARWGEDRGAGVRLARGSRVDLRWRVAPVVTAWVVAVIGVVVSIGLFPNYLSYASRSTLTPLIGVLIIAAIGQSFVIGTGGIDLSPGSVITLAGIAVGFVGSGPGGSLVRAFVVALLIGVGAGVLNGVLVEVLGLDSMVATLATYEALLGLATVWTKATEGKPSPQSWSKFVLHNWDGFSVILGMAIVLMLVITMVISHTTPGRRLTAASVGPVASHYQGIRYRRYRFGAYVFAGVTYAFAGICLVGVVSTPTTDMGSAYQFGTIVAVILGGASLTGGRLHPGATLAGAVFLTIVEQDISAFGLSTGFQDIVEGLIIVAAVLAMVGSGNNLIRRWRTRGSVGSGAPVAVAGGPAPGPAAPRESKVSVPGTVQGHEQREQQLWSIPSDAVGECRESVGPSSP